LTIAFLFFKSLNTGEYAMEHIDEVSNLLIVWGAEYGLKVIGALVILIIGRLAAGIGRRITQRLLKRANVDLVVVSFFGSLVYFLILAATVLAALAKFGVETASFIAIMGAAGFAVGFALQGSLANFAAGVLILVLRPFRVGDYIDVSGVAGTVAEIHLFTTVLNTVDNVKTMVPNGQIYGHTIKNFSANDTRRVDLVIGIDYGASIEKAFEVIAEVLKQDQRVLPEPAPTIAVAELGDSSVNLFVRPWVKKEDYWTFRFDTIRKIKESFDAAGIVIPFPQQTLHWAPEEIPVRIERAG
jgi:small conductance mechanosensitive channel